MLTPCGDKTSAVWALGWVALFAAVCYLLLRFDTRRLSSPKAAMLLIAALPVVRICVLMNHSYLHNFFTYRALMASIMAMLGLVWYRIGAGQKKTPKKK
jgi:glycerol-3-phosphate acyltransferase PlsY